MAQLTIQGSALGTALSQMLLADDIEPGSDPSYQLCKTIYLYHPLGAKMAESPISMAQSQQREIAIPDSPEEEVRDAFLAQWQADGMDEHIHNTAKTARIYGVSSLALLAEGVPPNRPIDYRQLSKLKIAFNVLDPLNTAGSLVLNQDPNSLDFQKTQGISVNGQVYHRSRCVVRLNERPIYIGYTNSAFGYVGRSVYQRALFPLKSFVQTMRTDDMVSRKAGVLIAMLKPAGSIVDNIMAMMAGMKRQLVKEAQTDNVISISAPEEKIESLNLQNLDGAASMARKNILENIAVSADMPAKLLNSETFAEGFGEGTEDAKAVARYIDRERVSMLPMYQFCDRITQHRAWTPEFYRTIQARFPEMYGQVGYTQAFYDWTNSFQATWPSLLTEPDSEKIKVEDTKLKAIIAMVEVLLPELDPANKAAVIAWAQDNFNENKMLFSNPMQLDFDALRDYVPPEPLQAPGEPRPFSQADTDALIARLAPRLRRRQLEAVR